MKKYILLGLMLLMGTVTFAQGKFVTKAPECANKMGTDSVETQKNLSLFNQYYQEKKYLESYKYWKYLFDNAPCIQKRITYAGPFIIKKKLKELNSVRKPIAAAELEKKKALKAVKGEGSQENYNTYKEEIKANKAAHSALVKEQTQVIFDCYQKRIEFFGKEGYIKGKWANDIVKLTPSDREKGLAMFKESIEMEGNNTISKVPKDYLYAGLKHYKKEKMTLDELFVIFDMVNPIIEFNVAKYTADSISAKDSIKGVKWVKTQTSVIGFMKPYLSCDKLKELKEPHFAEKSGDITWLKATVKLLDRGGCESKPFYLQCSEALYTLEPSSDAALSLAKAFGKQGDATKATSYYNKAADLAPTDEAKYDIYIKLAKIAKNNKKYSTVRDYARKALTINPNSGEAYILIGDAYTASASSCGSGDLGRSGVYLVAADKYNKAKNVDPSVADKAQTQLARIAGSFPNKEDAFFKGINAGDSYRVGCWIGESTTVRFGS